MNFDVTERKRTEAALRESEARLRIAMNAADLGVFESDVKADRMVWTNDRMFEIFGHTRAEFETETVLLQDYVHPDDVKAVKMIARCEADGRQLPRHLPHPPEERFAALAADRRKIRGERYR